MIIVVILDASRIWVKAIRSSEPLPTTETPPEPSLIWAPSGLIPTAAERERARLELVSAGPVQE
jgi:carbon starvation protein